MVEEDKEERRVLGEVRGAGKGMDGTTGNESGCRGAQVRTGLGATGVWSGWSHDTK